MKLHYVTCMFRDDFRDYAELCFWEFGDRVKNWITLNEPWTFSLGGYVMGTFAPGRGAPSSENIGSGTIAPSRCSPFQQHSCSNGNPGTEPYLVTHHQLLAHAATVELYKQKFQVLFTLTSYILMIKCYAQLNYVGYITNKSYKNP